ncbi:MAG: hypothetical protein PUC42_11080 [Bacteroidales bacterium]|nr:hypothetical protein [Bacteroidales bacterium]
MNYISFPYTKFGIKLGIGFIILILYFLFIHYVKKSKVETSLKEHLELFLVLCICEFAFLVDPLLDYNNVHGDSSIWYSGYIYPKERQYNDRFCRRVVYYDTLGRKRTCPVMNAGKYDSYLLFSKKGISRVALIRNIQEAVKNYCYRGVKKDKREKVFFLLELDNHHISDDSSCLGKECRVVSAVVDRCKKCCFYNVPASKDLIWYNEKDRISHNEDSLLIIYDKKERFKYNVYKRNPSKEEFEKFKYGIDFCNPSIKDK